MYCKKIKFVLGDNFFNKYIKKIIFHKKYSNFIQQSKIIEEMEKIIFKGSRGEGEGVCKLEVVVNFSTEQF